MLSVKVSTIGDIPLIQSLTYKVWPQTYNPIIGEEQVNYMLGQFYTQTALEKQITELNHKFIVVYDDEVPVAFASYGIVETGVFKLHKLYVAAEQQGKGIGAYIINYIKEELALRKITKLRLNVNIHNKNAISFYSKIGFRLLKDELIDIGNGFYMDDHVFELDI